LNVLGYFLFPSNHYLIINTGQEEHMVTPQATLPSIIFFGVESSSEKTDGTLTHNLHTS
jgi:hypothetical protein